MVLNRAAGHWCRRGLSGTLAGGRPILSAFASSSAFVIDGPGSAEIDMPKPGACPNFSSFITKNFYDMGEKPAIIVGRPDGTEDIRTYSGLLDDVTCVARGLTNLVGFGTGDTALVVSPNHADYFAAVHGVLALGGVISPANPMGLSSDIAFQLEDCGATLVFAHESVLEKVNAAVTASDRASRIMVIVLSDNYGVDNSGGGDLQMKLPFEALKVRPFEGDGDSSTVGTLAAEESHVTDDQLAVLPYSSGTTGRPKGVMLTHRNLVANVLQHHHLEGRYWRRRAESWASEDVLVSPLPFSHVFGFTVSLNLTLHYNATLVTLAGGFDMRRLLALVESHKCTRAHLVPPILLGLANAPVVDEFDLSSLGFVVSGAAPLPLDVGRTVEERLGCVIKQGWGMSELSGTGSTNPDDDNRPGTSGRPLVAMQFKIVDVESGGELPPGQEGEVVCAGPNVMAGYLNNPEASASAFTTDGWFKTGDIAVADEDGYLTFTDRLKELIKYKGFQVAPAELEAVLLTHAAVLDAAVIGVPDEAAGEVPFAFVVLASAAKSTDGRNADQDEGAAIAAWVADRVAPHKKIRGGVVQVEQIPKSPSGKILRRVLQQQYTDGGVKARSQSQLA